MADELERVARELFAAGASERPAPELRERLLTVPRERQRFRPGLVVLAGGVALAAAAVLAVSAVSPDAPDFRIDPETARASARPGVQAKRGNAPALPTAVLPPQAPLKQATAATKRQNPRSAESATPPRSLAAELALLNEARSHLSAGDGSRALELLSRHGKMPGALHAEATLLRMEALAATGRAAEAAALSREFVARYPQSPLVDRARSFSGEPTMGGVSP